MLYHRPRPFYTNEDMQVYKCSKSFGNPSGHASLSIMFYTTIFLLAFHDKPKREEIKEPMINLLSIDNNAPTVRKIYEDHHTYLSKHS
jgi:hypothetical protein